jgi:hypothetical protein
MAFTSAVKGNAKVFEQSNEDLSMVDLRERRSATPLALGRV